MWLVTGMAVEEAREETPATATKTACLVPVWWEEGVVGVVVVVVVGVVGVAD